MNKRLRKTPSQRLLSLAAKKELISNMHQCTIKLTKLVASSSLSIEDKEQLASFLMSILGILDIERERIVFERIKEKKQEGVGGVSEEN